eukprot:10121091-Lingulodinium_polyedra.AAC.1
MWNEGESKALVAKALAGARHLLVAKRCFPRARELYGIWQRTQLPKRVPPFLAEVAVAMAGY